MARVDWETIEAVRGEPVRWWARWLMSADGLLLVHLTLFFLVAYCWWYSNPEVAMVAYNYYGDFCYGVILFFAVAAARCTQVLVAWRCAIRHGIPFQEVRSRSFFWLWFFAIIAATFFLVRGEVPMHVRFLVSEPSLNSLADEALSDPANAHRLAGRRAGLYRVKGVEVLGQTVVLYLDCPQGNYGFARVPTARSDHIAHLQGRKDLPDNQPDFPPLDGPGFADPVGQRIHGDWFVVYSSYLSVKVGWS